MSMESQLGTKEYISSASEVKKSDEFVFGPEDFDFQGDPNTSEQFDTFFDQAKSIQAIEDFKEQELHQKEFVAESKNPQLASVAVQQPMNYAQAYQQAYNSGTLSQFLTGSQLA